MISDRKAQTKVKESEGEAKSIEIKAAATAKAKEVMARAEATQIEVTGKAEASKIEAIGTATAEAYDKQVKAMGADNFGQLKVVESIGVNNIKIIPEILITGGGDGNGPISGLLGMELLKQVQDKNKSQNTAQIISKPKNVKPTDTPSVE